VKEGLDIHRGRTAPDGRGFAQPYHMPIPLLDHIVYGPVCSRRLGRSLGVNLLPPQRKMCNMDCAYCQYGWTRNTGIFRGRATGWPTPAGVEGAVRSRLKHAAAEGEMIDRITVAGHGEPTLHPQFEEIADRLCHLRNGLAPGIRIAILSNSTTASRQDVRRGLALFDERHMKLDAGDPITYARINGLGVSIHTVVDALRNLPSVIVQAMFVRDVDGTVDNTTEGALAEWLNAIEAIQPGSVEIYTIDRAPAMPDLRPVPPRRLKEIAARVHTLGIPAEVFVRGA
jgi:wyosine [tRNA(Phe)-imidazoG37] synthetase (radical SAM superfamily)